MLKSNMVVDKRSMSARHLALPPRSRQKSIGQQLENEDANFTSSKYNFFKASNVKEPPKEEKRPVSKQKPTSPSHLQAKSALFKPSENLDLELESFALFLDEDEKQDKLRKQQRPSKPTTVYHHNLNTPDINPEKPSYLQEKRPASSLSRSKPKAPTPIAASI